MDKIQDLERKRQNYVNQIKKEDVQKLDIDSILRGLKNDKHQESAIQEYQEKEKEKQSEFMHVMIPKMYWEANIKDADKRICEFLYNKKTFCWVYGGVGVGKTYALYAIKKEQILQGKKEIKIIKEYDISFDTSLKGFLAIDDFGLSENPNRNIVLLDIYFNLIDSCLESERKLIITSNYSISEWLAKMNKFNSVTAQRIASRLSNVTEQIKLEGGDRRKI